MDNNNIDGPKVKRPIVSFDDLGDFGKNLVPGIVAVHTKYVESIEEKKKETTEKLNHGQNSVGVINKLADIINNGKADDGSFHVNNELKKVLDDIIFAAPENRNVDPDQRAVLKDVGFLEMKYDKDVFNRLIDACNGAPDVFLPQEKIDALNLVRDVKPSEEQMDLLMGFACEKENQELRALLQDGEAFFYKQDYTKVQIDRISKKIKVVLKKTETNNSVESQKLTKLDSESSQMYQMLNSILKKLDDIMMKIASKIGGR